MEVTEEVIHTGELFFLFHWKNEASRTWWIMYFITDLSLHDEGMYSTLSVQMYFLCSALLFTLMYSVGESKNVPNEIWILFLSV